MDAPTNYKSTFAVPKMDCPSAERMVRMALDGLSVAMSKLRE